MKIVEFFLGLILFFLTIAVFVGFLFLIGSVLFYLLDSITDFEWPSKKDKSWCAELPKLSFNQFKSFVVLNPDAWKWEKGRAPSYHHKVPDGFLYGGNHRYVDVRNMVWFKSKIDSFRAWHWYNNMKKKQTRHEVELSEIRATAEFIDLMKKEVETASRKSEEMNKSARAQIEEILERGV